MQVRSVRYRAAMGHRRSIVVALSLVVPQLGCGLAEGLFSPSPEEKQEVVSACGLQPLMPVCVDPESSESLPAWARFNITAEELDCIRALDCQPGSELDENQRIDQESAVDACIATDGGGDFTLEEQNCRLDCVGALDDTCDTDTSVEDAMAAHDRCKNAC